MHSTENIRKPIMKSAILDPLEPPTSNGLIPKSFAKDLEGVSFAHMDTFYSNMLNFLGVFLGTICSYIPCISFLSSPYVTVNQGSVGIISKFGKAYRIVDPGLYFINKITENIKIVDVTLRITSIPSQSVITKDNVSIDIDSVVYWHIIDPFTAVFQVDEIVKALMERTMTTLKDTAGAYDFQSLVTNREDIAREIKTIIEHTADKWGVVIEAILIKDLILSKEMQDSMASAAKQTRYGESKIIAAKAEVEASRLMREASDILNTPAAMQIRYLDTLSSMSKASGSKIIFMPVEHNTNFTPESIGSMLRIQDEVDH
ncbi:hypothetical protein MDAP_002078 [Mitosporidium daphniae]